MKYTFYLLVILASMFFYSCAGERQGLVCDELEYRLNTQTYSPDQRVFMEEELRVCREDEAKKKGEAKKTSIYERFANENQTPKESVNEENKENATPEETASVAELLGDSTGGETTSIYDRFKADSSLTE